ncbi:MAG: RNA polymerase sigma factor [Burkholderiaceae bacterium]
MATRDEMDAFLASVERRAFKQAVFAVRDDHHAADIVQDAMLRLVKSYGERPAEELAPLFQRILQNVITDHFRREKVRNLWTTLVSALMPGRDDGESEQDFIDAIRADDEDHWRQGSAADQVERGQTLTIIENEIKKLPERQRQAFLLRYWEELDVAETAEAMGCSQGSVKTHCSRATRTLAKALSARGIRL